jgi:intron-binding protein aquarius
MLGRRSVFESVFELKPAFDILFQRSDKLSLVTDEMYGATSRPANVNPDEELDGEAIMEGVEHLGKYVYDMQNAKFEALKANGGQLPTREINMRDAVVDEDEDREDNVLIPEEAADDFDDEDEDEDEDVEVRSSGRHLEVKATSSVQLR